MLHTYMMYLNWPRNTYNIEQATTTSGFAPIHICLSQGRKIRMQNLRLLFWLCKILILVWETITYQKQIDTSSPSYFRNGNETWRKRITILEPYSDPSSSLFIHLPTTYLHYQVKPITGHNYMRMQFSHSFVSFAPVHKPNITLYDSSFSQSTLHITAALSPNLKSPNHYRILVIISFWQSAAMIHLGQDFMQVLRYSALT